MPPANSEAETSATQRVQALIEITQSLNEIFEQENAALIAQQVSELQQYQADKARLAASYAVSIRNVAADRNTIRTVAPEVLLELREMTACFEAHAAHQRFLLEKISERREKTAQSIPARATH
ncbi:hypothetical protein ABFZ85_04775 [Hyphococcus formosus]|uniref:hypothetical protein n=1 Tax=Hyphococcus formosus TaxID=3143534 RepID=UPI00398B6C07